MLDTHAESAAQSMADAADLLRCAAASAYESADHLSGSKRDLAFSVMHLIDMARGAVEKSLIHTEKSL
jgi:hypothetical protein